MTPSAIISDAAGSMCVPSATMRLPCLRIFSMPGFIRTLYGEQARFARRGWGMGVWGMGGTGSLRSPGAGSRLASLARQGSGVGRSIAMCQSPSHAGVTDKLGRVRLALIGCLAFVAAASNIAPEVTLLAYVGGSGTDDCDGIALDRAGNIYLACHSDSPDFPYLPQRAAPQSRDAMDAVIVKISARTGRIEWATRTGGIGWDAAGDIEVAADGAVYVLGSTESADFPTTPDAVQRRFGGPRRDGFLLKLDTAGRIVYCTFLGGSKNDETTSMAISENGDLFIGGVTMSQDFPGTRVSQFGPGGRPDGFVARLSPGDPKSLQTVLLGGKGRDSVTSLALDAFGNLFAAGYTASPDFATQNAVQARFGGGMVDAFLLKIRIAGWRVLFSTYLGGSKNDGAYSIALDRSGNPIVSGVSESDDFPSTPSAFQPRRRGPVDAFVAKLSSDGRRLVWSTYFGGSKPNSDQFLGGSVAADPYGRVWLTGMTSSPDLPTRNAFQPAYGGGDFDGFIAALSSDGTKLCYGSYLGGNAHDILEGLAVRNGRVYASGISSSTNLQQKHSQLQQGYGGGPYDSLLVELEIPVDRSCH